MKAIIIDDQQTNIDILAQLLSRFCPGVSVAGFATSVEQGYMLINQHRPDLIFLDVEMDGNTGFDLLKMFRHVFFKIIFISAHRQYAIDAFREHAVDYLLKPLAIGHLQEAVTRAEEQLLLEQARKSPPPDHIVPETKISLPTQEGYLFVYYNDILHCEASGSYSHFYFVDGKKMTVSLRLRECEELLPANIFCRVHHSYIVNVNHIKKYVRGRGGHLVLQNDMTIEVSSARKDEFLKLVRQM